MARKSRKKQEYTDKPADVSGINAEIAHVDDDIEYINQMPTAVYARLSMEDNGQKEDDSISTQIKLVKSYIQKKQELSLADIFVDNGHTGTDFDRPAFRRMMEKVKSGEIRCIVVKDLSRFGRNYVELGYYLENIFPLIGVRLIAVTDDFDSFRQSDRESLSIPIKNMVNTVYAKDISKKQGAVMEMRRRLGIQKYPFAPYGYQFNEQRQLIIDPETAPYVRMIFSWTIAGIRRSEIARRFQYMGIPTPMAVLQKQGRMASRKDNGWNEHTVKRILNNPVYAGTLALGKTKQSICKGIRHTAVPREDWVCFYDRHEAIVSKEDYRIIEDMIAANRVRMQRRIQQNASDREGLIDCFRGMVYCAECGKPMSFVRGSHTRNNYAKPTFSYYRCKAKNSNSWCTNQKIQQNLLKIVAAEQIREMIQVACDRKKILEKIKRDEVKNNRLRYYRRLIRTRRRDALAMQDRQLSLYTDFNEGILEEEDYQILKEKTIVESQKLKEEARIAEEKLLETEKALNSYIRKAEEMKGYLEETEFNENIMTELIERLEIHNGKRVTVVFKCSDVLENKLVEECLEGLI